MESERDPRNAPGDFYVRADECLLCGAPEHEAPDLITTKNNGCYFRRQPETPAEVDRAVEAVWVSCCSAVCYGGADPGIIAKLRERGVAADGAEWSGTLPTNE